MTTNTTMHTRCAVVIPSTLLPFILCTILILIIYELPLSIPARNIAIRRQQDDSYPLTVIYVSRRKLVYSSVISPLSKHHHHKRHIKTWFFDLVAGIGTGVVLGLGLSAWVGFLKYAIQNRPPTPVSGQTIFGDIFREEEDFKFLGWSDNHRNLEAIGRGGCGEVYKSEIPVSDGMLMVAIKKVNQPGLETDLLCNADHKQLDKRLRQVQSEILIAGTLRHPKLVPLLAHVYRPNCHYLVYKLMSNGSLHDILVAASHGARKFSWHERYNVARDIAVGLEYLHIVHHIVHRDLKPANILLDGNMEACISDFGLAKAGLEADCDALTSNIAGTVGYIAPEYYQIMRFTQKCDIYSFGVIMAVMVTGKFPCDNFFLSREETLTRWIRNTMRSKDPTRAIDKNLIGNGYEKQMLLMLRIACFCTYTDPKQRPRARDIRYMLSQIKH